MGLPVPGAPVKTKLGRTGETRNLRRTRSAVADASVRMPCSCSLTSSWPIRGVNLGADETDASALRGLVRQRVLVHRAEVTERGQP